MTSLLQSGENGFPSTKHEFSLLGLRGYDIFPPFIMFLNIKLTLGSGPGCKAVTVIPNILAMLGDTAAG